LKSPVFIFTCLIFCLAFSSYDQFNTALSSFAPFENLFEGDEVINIKLSGNLKAVLNDRGDNPQYHPIVISYFSKDSNEIKLTARAKTRGHFRKDKSNCNYPPLLLNIDKSAATNNSLFYNQQKLKLVMPCDGDEYVVREWLIYKLYNLITPKSFKARLVKVIMQDGSKRPANFYGFLLEDEKQMAQRNKTMVIERQSLKPQNTETDAFLTMAVFQYMIGNTDWSVQYQQNIKLLAANANAIPTTVPYDFDHSGMVNASYAHPAEELEMRSVIERRYRGYCVADIKTFDEVISKFNKLKNSFYNVYTNCGLIDSRYIKTATKYLDEFYETINDPKQLKKAFSYPCDPNGTGNIIIKGLRED